VVDFLILKQFFHFAVEAVERPFETSEDMVGVRPCGDTGLSRLTDLEILNQRALRNLAVALPLLAALRR